MVLTKSEISKAINQKKIIINPFRKESLTMNSYDIHLGENMGFYTQHILDVKKENKMKFFKIPKEGMILYPMQFYLGVTEEYIKSKEYVPFLEGKSSIGRLGITIHVTAGKGDIGYANRWTLEIFVIKPVRIYPFIKIGQLIFFKALGTIDKKDIGGKYSFESKYPLPSKSYKYFISKKGKEKLE